MALPNEVAEKLVFDLKLSSVVPGKIMGKNRTYELKGIDLAMKLHYIYGLYFFNNTNIIEGESNNHNNTNTSFMSIDEMKKEPMYDWLTSCFMTCGRIAMSSEGNGDRPSIKLNDAGIRMIEARSSKTVDEWLAMEDFLSLQHLLVYNHSLGPDLFFSPLVCLQVTWFKCGGISVGLSWAHILGDVLSASDFMNMWSQYMQGNHKDPKTLSLQYPQKSKHLPSSPAQEPISVKRVSPMGNNWVLPTSSKIHTHTFHLTPKQLDELHSKIHGSNNDINDNSTSQSFEVITAILWKSIAKVRNDLETKSVTICRPKTINRQQRIPYNGQVLGTIEANFLVSGANPLTLVNMIVGELVDENDMIEELVNKEIGKFDFIFYGTNITFVDMTEADVYDFKLKGNSPTFASYTVGGIQDKGAIFVFPGPNKGTDEDNRGKVIMLNLPKNEIHSVKTELKEGWCIA